MAESELKFSLMKNEVRKKLENRAVRKLGDQPIDKVIAQDILQSRVPSGGNRRGMMALWLSTDDIIGPMSIAENGGGLGQGSRLHTSFSA